MPIQAASRPAPPAEVVAVREDPAELEELDRDERQVIFIGRFHPQTAARAGERVEVAIQPGGLTLFDPETWERI